MSERYVTCRCQRCNKGIEFDADQLTDGQTVICPHCGIETALYAPITPQLKTCPDCRNQVSKNAESCPRCGALFKKRHGVFYYVVMVLISLFVISVLGFLAIGMLAVGVPAGIEAAKRKSDKINGVQSPVSNSSIENDDYIRNGLVLYDFESKKYDSYLDGKVPGYRFKIRNKGLRTLSKVEVTIYFGDSQGNTIYEEKTFPVLVSSFGMDNEPLKAGHIWQMESGRFYSSKKVPSEWQEGNAYAKITNVRFEDEK